MTYLRIIIPRDSMTNWNSMTQDDASNVKEYDKHYLLGLMS